MENRRLRVGVLGAGAIAQFAHLPALERCQRAQLAALCDAAPDLLARVGDKFNVTTRYDDYDALLNDVAVDAVIIAAPDAFHVPLAIRAMRAGKHVLVEKPLGETVEQCLELIRVQQETGVKVQVGSMKRHDPGMAFAQQFVRQTIGPILSVSGIYRDSTLRYDMQASCLDPVFTGARQIAPPRDPKNDREHYNLVTQGAHVFDCVQFLAGPIEAVIVQVAHQSGNWSWHGLLEFSGGGRGHFELTCKACADWCERYTVCGESGSVEVDVSLPFYHRPAQARCFDGLTQQWRQPLGARSNAYANQLDAFAAAVLDDKPTSPDAHDGLAAVAVLDAVEQSVRSRKRVAVPQCFKALP